jgi:hypothetical protein
MTKRAEKAKGADPYPYFSALGGMLDPHGGLGKTIDFVMRPRGVPSPANRSLDDYNWDCRAQFQRLLVNAFQSGALPERACLVQSVIRSVTAHSPDQVTDFSLHPYGRGGVSRAEAKRFCRRQFGALAYITYWFRNMGGISSHQSFREHGDTTVGNILIFSGSREYQLPSSLPFPAHGYFIGLKSNGPDAFSELPGLSGPMMDEAVDLPCGAEPIFEFLMDDFLKENASVSALGSTHPPAEVFNCHSSPLRGDGRDSDQVIGTIQASHNAEYLSRVAALAELGQIVIAAPQVMYYMERDHKSVFDSGLTLLLAGDDPPSLLELFQIFLVSRYLAEYAVSVFGIARQVALNERSRTLNTLAKTMRHEIGNMNENVKTRLELAPIEKATRVDIEARLDIAQLAAMGIVEHLEQREVKLSDEFRKYLKRWNSLVDLNLQVREEGLDETTWVPSAFILAINELIRNGYKHTTGKPKQVKCDLIVDATHIRFSVTNSAEPERLADLMSAMEEGAEDSEVLEELRDLMGLMEGGAVSVTTEKNTATVGIILTRNSYT